MPYVTDDDSKAVRRITEIERELQEAKAEFEGWLAAGGDPMTAAALSQRERQAIYGNAFVNRAVCCFFVLANW